jgi:hypothetical protein
MAAETQQAENPWNGDYELLKHLLLHPWSGNSLAMDDDRRETRKRERRERRSAPSAITTIGELQHPQRQVRFRPLPGRSTLRFLGFTGPSSAPPALPDTGCLPRLHRPFLTPDNWPGSLLYSCYPFFHWSCSRIMIRYSVRPPAPSSPGPVFRVLDKYKVV